MTGREDWGRTEDDLMRARGAVDEVLVCTGLAPAHFDENLRARVSGSLFVGGASGSCQLAAGQGWSAVCSSGGLKLTARSMWHGACRVYMRGQ